MGKHELIADLRHRIGSVDLIAKESWAAPQLLSGVPKGALVELLGSARTEWLLQFFLMHPEPFILWCETKQQVNPTAIYQRGIPLERIKFINTLELQQPLRMALDSGQYPFIVAPQTFAEIKIFQRLQLCAEKSKATVFFLPFEQFSSAWPISLQLDIATDDLGFNIAVQRQRYGN